MTTASALKIREVHARQRTQLRAIPSKSKFDLNIPEFRAYLKALTGLDFDSPLESDQERQWAIHWWNTATEEDARKCRVRTPEDRAAGVPYWENTGEINDKSSVWRIQTTKIQLVWDAWKAGRRITLNEIQAILHGPN